MTYRGLLRQPAKRMLIFFNVDQTTAVLETTKVKHVLQGDMIKEGATVLVDFGKEEFEKEPLSFLHEAEQEKVRKLVSQCQKIGETEVAIQTDFGTHSKDVAVQKNGNEQPKCSCHDVLLEKVTSLEKKIKQLVSAIEHPINKPGYPKSSDVFSSINQSNFDSFDTFDEEPSVMQTISEVASICANRTLPGMAETSEEETAVLTTSFVTPPVCAISPSIYDDMFKKSSSTSNYAKNLVFSIFDKEELVDCNCSGTHEKKALESDSRMDLIKESTFKKFPTEDRKKSWASCRKTIDSAIRKLRFKAS